MNGGAGGGFGEGFTQVWKGIEGRDSFTRRFISLRGNERC